MRICDTLVRYRIPKVVNYSSQTVYRAPEFRIRSFNSDITNPDRSFLNFVSGFVDSHE